MLQEVLGKICHNKKIPVEQDDGVAPLAEVLLKTETIPESLRDELLALHHQFQRTDAGAEELTAATDWILSFLNDYLGGQILILN